MKKIKGLSSLALIGVLAFAGCSCNKERGVYEFDSLVVTVGDESTRLTCSDTDIAGNPFVAGACSVYKPMTIELEKDGKMIQKMDLEGEENDTTEEGFYKIEEGKLFFKEEADDEWEEAGTYNDGEIAIGDESFKIVFKKAD